eukprot:TRINITY_DN49092_c0_g1_i1.p1 TRINITY_DN49092_c0_g1~~TRINITY_DN49092_c0_g1_i1.p1  ORF type:complete len:286 (+),score=53.12 TRINITY_DN49092_c0_g1_i1:93-950(+)
MLAAHFAASLLAVFAMPVGAALLPSRISSDEHDGFRGVLIVEGSEKALNVSETGKPNSTDGSRSVGDHGIVAASSLTEAALVSRHEQHPGLEKSEHHVPAKTNLSVLTASRNASRADILDAKAQANVTPAASPTTPLELAAGAPASLADVAAHFASATLAFGRNWSSSFAGFPARFVSAKGWVGDVFQAENLSARILSLRSGLVAIRDSTAKSFWPFMSKARFMGVLLVVLLLIFNCQRTSQKTKKQLLQNMDESGKSSFAPGKEAEKIRVEKKNVCRFNDGLEL